MKFQIRWKAFLKVKNELKADKLLKQIENSIGQKIETKQYERYWKDTSIIEANFISKFNEDLTVYEVVFRTLELVKGIGYMWSVYSPRIGQGSNNANETVLTFEGIHNNPRITGVTWIQFVVETDTMSEYGW